MPDILKKDAKIVNNPDGSIHIVFDQPVVTIPPVIPPIVVPPLDPDPVKDIELKFGSGLPTGEIETVIGEPFMIQSPALKDSIVKANNVKAPVYKFKINAGEVWKGSDGKSGDLKNSNRERTEFYLKGANFPVSKDIWISYGIKIEENFKNPIPNSEFIYLGQAHASEDKGDVSSNAVFGFKFDGVDKLELVTSSATQKIHTVKPKAVSRGVLQLDKEVWHQIVIRVKFHPTKGEIQVWLDGKEKVNFKNIGIGYNDTTGPYWKFGIYRSPMPGKLVVEYANMEVGKNESLQDRILKPLKIE